MPFNGANIIAVPDLIKKCCYLKWSVISMELGDVYWLGAGGRVSITIYFIIIILQPLYLPTNYY